MSEIQVRGPKGCAKTLSFDGKSYSANKQGIFSVPSESWEHLQRHGFKVDGQEEEVVTETDEERAAREAAEAEAAQRTAEEEAAKAAAANGGAQS
jgi:hypothetical protein